MKAQISLKCPQCGDVALKDVTCKKPWIDPTTNVCIRCDTIYVFEVHFKENVTIYTVNISK